MLNVFVAFSPSWGHLGAILGGLGAVLGGLWAVLGGLGPVLGRVGREDEEDASLMMSEKGLRVKMCKNHKKTNGF